MNSSRFLKRTLSALLSLACGANYAHAQVDNYSAQNTTDLANCQANKNCSREQKAQIEQYKKDVNTAEIRSQTQMCNGRTCSAAELSAMTAQQTKDVSSENAAAYQNGVNAANGGTLTTPTYATNSSANNSGTSASSGNNGMIVMVASAGAAVAAATVLKKPCMSAFSSAWACPLMAVAIVQVGASLLSSKGSGASKDALSGGGISTGSNGSSTLPTTLGQAGGGGANDGTYGGNVKLAGEAGQIAAAADKLANEMKGTGYSVSPDGSKVTGPNGKPVPTSAFSSPQAMKDAGFSDSQISDMQSTMEAATAAANDQFKKMASNLSNDASGGGKGGGSGSSENGGSGGGYGGDYGFDASKMLGKNSKLKNSVAGMSKKLGDDNIGVAGDNIFEMISRRYQTRDKQNNFIVDQK